MAGNDQFILVFNKFLEETGKSNAPHLNRYNFNDIVTNQIDIQYLTYIYGCAAGNFLTELNVRPSHIAGYSMGIYAALYQTGSISFHSGLELIRMAYLALDEGMSDHAAGMGTIIGLCRSDIIQLMKENSLNTEITNQNAEYSFVISGLKEEVHLLLSKAREEGALHTRDLMVSLPYHYSHLAAAAAKFEKAIRHLEIRDPETQILSLVDQAVLSSAAEIRKELVRNLFQSLNWMKTQQTFLDMGISLFIEAGASRGLAKNARFIDGDYRFLTLDMVLKSHLSPS